jgi:protein SCO1/2
MKRHFYLFILAICITALACERPSGLRLAESKTSGQDSRGATIRGSSPKSYKLVGIVRKVDRNEGVVTIRHDAIPGFMGAMTMPFDVKDRSVLEDIQPGDEVEGRLTIEGDSTELTDLRVTKLASPPGARGVGTAPSPALKPGELVPDFAMTTQEGKSLALSDLRGKVVVLTFIYTRCPLPDFCPLMDRRFKELAGRLAAVRGRSEGVRLLSVSFDPQHDTPERLAQHARMQGAKAPIWTFAVASHEELGKVAQPVGLMYGAAGNEVVHNLTTAVVDQSGRLAAIFPGRAWTVDEAFKMIVALIKHA